MPTLRDSLSIVPAYIGVQRILGADRIRYRTIAELNLQPGEVVIDIGCGPAYYFDRIPNGVRYFGFDTSERYISWDKRKFGHEGTFVQGTFDLEAANLVPPADAIILLGLLHHLDDEQSRDLLALLAGVLAPGGRIVTVDAVYSEQDGRLARWISQHDRGEHVRFGPQFDELARDSFSSVESVLDCGSWREPANYWVMRLSDPIAVGDDEGTSVST